MTAHVWRAASAMMFAIALAAGCAWYSGEKSAGDEAWQDVNEQVDAWLAAKEAEDAKALSEAADAAAAAEPAQPAVIDLNSASAELLDTLPGIGPSKAAAIIAHREAHGPFQSIEEIMKVKGIGPATYEKLKPFIAVSTNHEEAPPEPPKK
jgi:comEA protein